MEELAQLHRRGNTIIMVTHNPNLTSYASRVIKMLDGQIASDEQMRTTAATPTPVARKPRVRRAAPAGKAAPTIAQGTASAAQPAAPVKAIARGRPAKAPAPATTAPTVVDYEDPHTQDGPTIEPMPVAPPEVPPALPATQHTPSAGQPVPSHSASPAHTTSVAPAQSAPTAPQPTNQPAAPVAHTTVQPSSTPSAASAAQPVVATPAQQPTTPSSAHQSSTKEPQA